FEDQLVDMKNGETKTFNITFPDDYQKDKFAGREVTFTITIKSIKEKKLPELDEEFIKNFEKYNTLEDLKKDIVKSLEEESKTMSESKLQQSIIENLLKENEIEVPSSLVEKQIYYMMADAHRRMLTAGMDEQSALDISFKMHDNYKEEAAKIVKTFLILKAIAEKESFIVEDTDVDKHIAELAEKHGRDYQQLKGAYEKDDKKDSLKVELAQKKVFDFIQEHANIKAIEKTGMSPEVKE
ncbi:MAG: trigger factor, partial [Smithellaceae bacterium]